jgi:hypothetical protein
MLRFALTAAPLFALALAACSDGGGTSGSGGQTTTTTSDSVCAADSGAVDYAVGLTQSAMDGKVTISFADADPAPPAKGLNKLTIDVTDDAGQPIDGATIAVKSCMPLHGHCSTITPTITAGSQPGRYVIDQVELFMPGLWEIALTVTPSGGAADPVSVSFCIEG